MTKKFKEVLHFSRRTQETFSPDALLSLSQRPYSGISVDSIATDLLVRKKRQPQIWTNIVFLVTDSQLLCVLILKTALTLWPLRLRPMSPCFSLRLWSIQAEIHRSLLHTCTTHTHFNLLSHWFTEIFDLLYYCFIIHLWVNKSYWL